MAIEVLLKQAQAGMHMTAKWLCAEDCSNAVHAAGERKPGRTSTARNACVVMLQQETKACHT
jgi:hypothetical protein